MTGVLVPAKGLARVGMMLDTSDELPRVDVVIIPKEGHSLVASLDLPAAEELARWLRSVGHLPTVAPGESTT